MNYSNKKTQQKQKRVASKSTRQKKRVGVRLFKAFLLIILFIGIATLIGGGIFLKKIIDDAPEITPKDVQPQNFTSIAYADDGTTEIDRFVTSGSNRIYRTIDEIPADLQHAFVAVEDERFYKHKGVDPQGTLRAAVSVLASGSFDGGGGSTITQQLVKNMVFPEFAEGESKVEKIERKLQEMYLSLKIEKEMDKNMILESYMNTVNLGQNALGVQTAAQTYFGKDVKDITLSEATVIAGITQNPTRYNPITNPDLNKARRQVILDKMLEQGYIEKAAYDEALADDVYARIQQNYSAQVSSPNSYFVDALSQQILEDLQTNLSYSQAKAYHMLYGGGLNIQSTQSTFIQSVCEQEMNNPDNFPYTVEYGLDYRCTIHRADGTMENYSSGHIFNYSKDVLGRPYGLIFSSQEDAEWVIWSWKTTVAQEGDVYDEVINISPQPQASVSVIDQSNGHIKGIVGGRGEKSSSQSLNRAYKDTTRQPGSVFKIITAYAPAFDTGMSTLSTVEKDEAIKKSDGTTLVNAYPGYLGSVTLRTAINESINTVAYKTTEQVTLPVAFDYAKKLGISTLIESEEINGKIYSDLTGGLPLGSLTKGVRNYEVCSAFAAIANGGVYNAPTLYTKVLDMDGHLLLDGTGEQHQAIKDSTAYLLTSAMETVVSEGTGTAYSMGDMAVAGKTGTTDYSQDYWFAGFTRYYTCTVWVGYDELKEMPENFNPRIWTGIMNRIHEGLAPMGFDPPASVEQLTVCRITGKLAGTGCSTFTEWFAKDTAPTETCPGHYVAPKPSEDNSDSDNTDSSEADNTDDNSNDGNTGDGTTDPPAGGGITEPPTGGETEGGGTTP
ncbi:penicillin-binding protein 1A [Lachnospiraceae bacterium PF1-22]|uniref:transglycosylase domain-containing protein n=1 Tax=Ohessyouella blattaphilus TaxID=2949333 RepID=UPI002564860B|nr:penicillin-binding protein [Lachnospiraceae bacterium OttesenSCG-928-J05]